MTKNDEKQAKMAQNKQKRAEKQQNSGIFGLFLLKIPGLFVRG